MKKFYSLCFCIFFISPLLSAQTGSPVTDTLMNRKPISKQLKEVVIKDKRLKLRKEEEALNVETVNSDFIKRHLGGSLMQSLERLPGIKTIGIGSGQSKPLIRGMGFNRVVVVDKGLKHEGQQWGADHGLEIDQFAAAEVELVKGAASFRYGSDAIAGVIDLKPPALPMVNSLGGSVDLIGKSNNSLYGTSVNLFGRTRNWFFDSRFTYQNYGDYRVPADTVFVYDYAVRLHERQLRNTAGRETAIHFTSGYVRENFSTVFYLSNVYSNSGFFANAHGLEPRRVDVDMHDASDRDVQMPSQQVNHFKLINRSQYKLPGQQLEMELGYQHNFRQEFSQYVNHGYMPPVFPDHLGISPELERQFDKKVYSLNFRDEISIGAHQLNLGINAEHQHNAIAGWTFLVPAFNQSTAGMFVYDKYRLNEKVWLHAALRYDFGHIRMFKYTDWFNSEQTINGRLISEKLVRADDFSKSFHSAVWSLGLNYNLDQFQLKANIGKSFRIPIAKELGANGVNYHYFSYERGNPKLDPEQSYQGDLSFGWTTERWSVLLSPFYNYFPNYIYLNPTSEHDYYYGAGNQIFQYAQSRVARYGAEMQIKLKLLEGWSTSFLGEYLQARQLSGDKKGYTLPFSPPASGLFNLTWSPPAGRIFKDAYLSADYRLTASQNQIVPPEKKTPAYQLINVQAGTKIKCYSQPLMLSLQVQNLMNTAYLNHTSFYRLIELPESGRNVILSLKIPFILSKNNISVNEHH
ncbi:TonB-dependent receptor [Pedobacter sp. MC2016-24]|uniref:TonB-dependent receptor n=1 Tax=Pedobacter sp. MC2016-24 TaxID=2780090 RepID=UPI001880655E|nr:TonB-dependent receptor [Pedobacter sp. MC2016-24]MBE9601835.1 TonB-dependent receptor [Pedobacter sp. MC2016-24]